MERMQINLEPELNEQLSRIAARRGISKAQILKEGAWKLIGEEALLEDDPIMDIIGLGQGEPGVVSEEHDGTLIEHKLRQAQK